MHSNEIELRIIKNERTICNLYFNNPRKARISKINARTLLKKGGHMAY